MSFVMHSSTIARQTDQAYMSRKLDHYNAWLLDPKRTAGIPYAGFPEDIERDEAIAKLKAEKAVELEKAATDTKPKAAALVKKAKPKRAKQEGAGPTKQDRAVEIFKELGGDKAKVIAAIQERLGMSLAGSTTYFYNAKKLAR